MKRNRIVIGLLAGLMVVAGGLYGANQADACGSCPAHALVEKAEATSAEAGSCHTGTTADAKVSTAAVKNASGSACCAASKTDGKLTGAGATCATKTDAKLTGAGATCATKTDGKLTGAGATCATKTDGKLTSAGSSCALGAKAKLAKAEGDSRELLTAEATLAKLAHCGININSADTDVLAAKLADEGCASYSQAQWTSMIDAAKGLDAEKSEVVLASVKSDPICSSDACPMTQVAKDLASTDGDTKKN